MTKKPQSAINNDQLSKSSVNIVDGKEKQAEPSAAEVKAAASILGRKGGMKGGPSRAAKLSPSRRSEIAQKAAMARWHKKKTG